MLELTDKEKLEHIEKRVSKLEALNELFNDSLNYVGNCQCTDKYSYVCSVFTTYIYQILIILGKYEYDKEQFIL